MSFGPFVIISLFYAVIGIRVIYRLIGSWSSVWDKEFTQQDRSMVDEAAFFALVPVSVALHELGHATAIWSMGGDVVGWGFYGFAGFVSYYPYQFSDVQQTFIAAAGSLVNLVLCLAAFGFVLFKRPPARSSVNELLVQFGFLSGANAFIAYPLLDLASGLNGDWRQMYGSGVPWFTGSIILIQAGVLGLGYWLATNPGMKARLATVTGVRHGFERGLFGGIKPVAIQLAELSPVERTLQEAADRVASGWSQPVKSRVQRFDAGTAMIVEWGGNQDRKAIATRVLTNGRTDIVRLHSRPAGQPSAPPTVMHQWPSLPADDQLTVALRIALETVDATP